MNLTTDGTYGVAWSAQDENLNSDSIRLECRYQNGATTWHPVQKARGSFSARDGYTWSSIPKENGVLEVRVSAKDKAGHEASSRIVRLPATGAAAGGTSKLDTGWDTTPRSTSPSYTGTAKSGGDWSGDTPNQPSIMYVNKRDLIVKSKLQTVTRSGVKTVHLFWKDLGRNPNSEWLAAKPLACDKPFGTVDLGVDIPHTVLEDGRYGFIVIPESGAGNRDPNPRSIAQPQHLVEVDTIQPVVKIRRAIATPGGSTGTRLEIEWDADDINMQTDPIDLLYSADPNASSWSSIAEKIPNSRRYVWDVPEKTPFKIYLMVKAKDKALNEGFAKTTDPVIIDLDKPSAVIPQIVTSGTGGAAPPPAPSTQPPQTLPAATVQPLSGGGPVKDNISPSR